MELIPKIFLGDLNKKWRSRRRNHSLDGARRKKMNVTRFGGKRAIWRIKALPKLKLNMFSTSKLWRKFKNAYVNMMLNLSRNVSYLNNGNVFGGKRIPKARQVEVSYTNNVFENRLMYEIYKSLVPSMELHPSR
ncbi:hypothetical protein RND71_014204 [Anisodus tanguticus]|uniref:Uncharacterized protein n=1 Tax=Anisodus tanguticus TaxID=243964 RepID=A0AAE1VMI8_9SOLA|nr:hypothetical protein RND71_014204 [Anisodus tanguticus]